MNPGGRISQLWVFQNVAMKEDSLLVGISPVVTSPSNTQSPPEKKPTATSAFKLLDLLMIYVI